MNKKQKASFILMCIITIILDVLILTGLTIYIFPETWWSPIISVFIMLVISFCWIRPWDSFTESLGEIKK